MDIRSVRKLLAENAVLRLYPEVAEILELSRSSVYERAKEGSIQTIPFGRLRKVPTAWLRRMLELDDPAE
jgi:predicted DNA-binding transcriptional regulator AlpA